MWYQSKDPVWVTPVRVITKQSDTGHGDTSQGSGDTNQGETSKGFGDINQGDTSQGDKCPQCRCGDNTRFTDDQNGVVTPVTVTSVYNAGVVTTPDSQMTKMV